MPDTATKEAGTEATAAAAAEVGAAVGQGAGASTPPSTPLSRLFDMLQGWNRYAEETQGADAPDADAAGSLYVAAAALDGSEESLRAFLEVRVLPALMGR